MRVAVVSTSIIFSIAAGLAAPAPEQRPVDFNRDIRPILSDKCFLCHGPSETGRMANLRLDIKEGAFAERKGYHILKPGDSANSRLYQRVSHEKKPLRMPPPTSGLSLTDNEIALMKRWIDEGAKWESHWAYVPPARPEEPDVRSKRVRNPIDKFVLARLDSEGLKPSPEADKVTLLRRVTFDLTGLPPTPAEIDAFLKDRSSDAYEKVVDRLLASPRYGERMAMHWLDLARYADTHGYHIDSHRDMWAWRDWVINAFNRNIPWDRFTVEQLAGDLLPDATTDQMIASGFNRNHMINFEGGAIPEEYLNEYVVDRVDTTSTVFMGMTMGCARCHDHKYDPIKQSEYYQLYAFFNRVSEKGLDGRAGNAKPILQLATPEQRRKLDECECEIDERERRLSDEYVDSLIAEWQPSALEQLPRDTRDGITAHYEFDGSLSDVSGGYKHGRLISGEIGFGGGVVGGAASFNGEVTIDLGDIAALKAPFSISTWVRSGGVNAMGVLDRGASWSLTTDNSIPLGDLTRGSHLYFTLNGQTLRTRDRIFDGEWQHLTITNDGSQTRVWTNAEPCDMIAAAEPSIAAAAKSLVIPRGFQGGLDDLRFYSRILTPEEIRVLAVDHGPRMTLRMPEDTRSKDQKQRLREYFLEFHAPEYERTLYAELEDLRKQRKQLDKQIPSVMVMSEIATPPDTHILGRGDYRNLGDKVTAGTPSALPPMSADLPRNRLGLAKWLVDAAHPLTSRVTVNRFWAIYFGTGLVKTVEDFGSQGELPSHPQLLDWLATEFIRTGWDVKAMQKLIVTSATYRQASESTPDLNQRDPENRLLARGPRFRLPAEMIRDMALASSGLLEEKIGGPSVFPYSPERLWEDIAFGNIYSAQIYPDTKPEDLYRRSMYTFWKRTAPPATLNTFDAPDREKCIARRPVTNTPLQALALMNDPTFVEASRMLAQRMILEGGTSSARRIRHGFRLVTGRVPSSEELSILRALVQKTAPEYKDQELAEALLEVGEEPSDPAVAKSELATWTVVASAIMNLDEAITKE